MWACGLGLLLLTSRMHAGGRQLGLLSHGQGVHQCGGHLGIGLVVSPSMSQPPHSLAASTTNIAHLEVINLLVAL